MHAGHRTFDADAPFVARCAFTFNGVEYATGAPFPARELGLDVAKIWELWGGRAIDNATAAPPAKPIAPPQPAQPKQQARATRR